MKQICIGILAHVDAGKTTLSEALLYRAGAIRRLGRVDHQDAFLDTDAMERQQGITIFSKQAVLELGDTRITLLDTPGHVDFSAEMERTLQVLDCAVLVISGTDGVQGHTRTLWDLLERYQVPTFLFINKMDLAGADREALLAHLKDKLSGGCVDFGDPDTLWEEAAVCDEAALEQYLEMGELSEDMISRLIGERKLFPCYFGSALKVEGVDELLAGVERYAPQPDYPAEFGAKVFKITRDAQGARLTHMKITGGALHTKELLTGREGDTVWQEKADQLRLYSGSKFHPVDTAEAGAVVAVTGLSLYTAAFVCESLRSGINTVPIGQAEAARALGLGFMQSATQIILPQAFRGSVAPLGNTLIALLKNSTVAAAASVATETSSLMSTMIEFHPDVIVQIFLIFAFGYVILIIPIGMLTTYLSNKLAVRR